MTEYLELRKVENGGEWVESLQNLLHVAGYWLGSIDGIFGDDLEESVIQFQSVEGLPADGVVRQDTWDALIALTEAAGEQQAEAEEEAMETHEWQDATAMPPARFVEMWADEHWQQVYVEWARTNFMAESVDFLHDVEMYRYDPTWERANELYRRYFDPNSNAMVNVDSATLEGIRTGMANQGDEIGWQRQPGFAMPADLFDEAYQSIMEMLDGGYRNFRSAQRALRPQRGFFANHR